MVDDPSSLNDDPNNDGWLVRIEMDSEKELATKMYEFLDRLLAIALPRVRDFRGLSSKSFDSRGNYNLGIKEQIIFPEVDYDKVDEIFLIDCRDFKYILEFTRIFYHLFWIKELLPDRIKSIEDDIKKSDEIKY